MRASPTLSELVLARADDANVGYVFEGAEISWKDVVHESRARAALIDATCMVDRPRHVGVLLENEPEYLYWVAAAALAEATVVGLNPTRRGAELARDIDHTDCQFVVTGSPYRELLPDTVDVIDVRSGDYLAQLDSRRKALPPISHANPDATVVLLFTSGSTNDPKAVPLSNQRAGSAGQRMADGFELTDADVAYCQMPLFHGNALLACWAAALAAGAQVVLRRRFSASEFLVDVRAHQCTYFTYVGRSIQYVLAQPESPNDHDNSLRVGFGTEAAPADRAAFTERFGCRLVESYGSSESAIVIVRTPDTPPEALGVPRDGDDSDVAVVDEDGRECAVGEIGELVNRAGGGPFTGYYNNPEATAHRTRHGWYWSGDLAWKDADGFFHFAGRADDRLRVDGENLTAAPIAALLERLDGIAAAAVYAVADPTTGDMVMAAIEMAPGVAFDPDAFHADLMAQPDLGTKWPPRVVRIVDVLPMTANNKVQIGLLRRQGVETTDPIWTAERRGGRYVRR